MRALLASSCAALLLAAPLHAQVVLQDTFNAESSGLNYNSFANWDVVGQVDVVSSGTFGITCDVRCVDLDGSSGPGQLRARNAFALGAGERWTFAFLVSGNQRQDTFDDVVSSFLFTGGAVTGGYSGTGGYGFVNLGPDAYTAVGISSSVSGRDGFAWWSVSFDVLSGGAVGFSIGTNSADNVGPIIDEVLISKQVTAVPEPASLALLLTGVAGLGITARRSRRRVA